jgi:hypothetical protein
MEILSTHANILRHKVTLPDTIFYWWISKHETTSMRKPIFYVTVGKLPFELPW